MTTLARQEIIACKLETRLNPTPKREAGLLGKGHDVAGPSFLLLQGENGRQDETMARIFLAHAIEDKLQVREVYARLKRLGFAPWLAEEELLPGQNWDYEIKRALEAADFVLVFLSTRSVNKIGYVQREFRRALDHSEEMPEGYIHTIPVKLDDCEVPSAFRHHQWANLYEEGSFERIVRALHMGLQQRGKPLPEQLLPVPPGSEVSAAAEVGTRETVDRSSVSMRVIDPEQLESPALNKDRRTLAHPFPIGGVSPIPVRTGRSDGGRSLLFSLRLANACRNGFGFARWQCWLTIDEHKGIIFTSPPLQLVDEWGHEQMSGELRDSPDESERVCVLTAELENDEHNLRIFQQFMTLNVTVGVEWELYEDGEHNLKNVQRFQTELALQCSLKHEPPNSVLAIDFGTSALAIASSVGSSTKLLPLQERLREIARVDYREYRLDNPGGDSPFLSIECNVNPDFHQLAKLRPNDKDFLVLPLSVCTIGVAPEMVFVSLKTLVSAGFKTLPLPVQRYPYLGEDGQTLETVQEPPLDEVIEGAYRGLMDRYIKPILDQQGTEGFSHLLVTYPNSYTPNHVQQLREVVERVFVDSPDILPPNVIYPENIKLFSESDAVAFYYLSRACEFYGDDWSRIPDCERILVYNIGAGTLDLTYLEVDWETNPNEGKTPKAIHIKHRDGTNRAGNLLDECIARDLHECLQRELDDERYINPIVVPSRQKMDMKTRYLMDVLRHNIQQLKVQLSEGGGEGEVYRLLLTPQGISMPIVKGMGGETAILYEDCQGITVINNQVYWEVSREQILNGHYVKAFLDQVTHREIHNFFNDSVPTLDTVILSGRTPLLPGFEDHLKEYLGAVPNWVSFNHDSTELKKSAVLGVIEWYLRWQHLVVEDPGIIGDFVVRYERRGPNDWYDQVYAHSEQSHTLYLGNSAQVRIGIRSSNGFHQCFALPPSAYYSDDKNLDIKLIFDRSGRLQAEVTNSRGRVERFRKLTNVATLTYKDLPWPWGASKLLEGEPEVVVT